jgi:hypothetical protein
MARMMRWATTVTGFLCLAAALVATPALGAEAVTVEKEKVKVEVKYFDPKHLPDPPPPIGKGEAAVTVYGLGIETYVRYGYREPAGGRRGPVKIDFTISQVSVKLKCTITEWLPENPPASLRAHEDGHRAIAEAFYKRGEAVARRLAAKEAGRTVTGRGDDVESAGNTAIEQVTARVNGGYTKAIVDPCKVAQEKFDTITAHGTNSKDAQEAVKEVVK